MGRRNNISLDMDSVLTDVTREAVETFRRDYLKTGYVNTGESGRRIEAAGNEIKAPISIHTLVFGRRPGKYPPWGYMQGTETPTSLMQWCMDIFHETAKDARSTSFLVARKLKEYGNRVYRGAVPPIPTEPTIEEAGRLLFEKVSDTMRKVIKSYDE